MPHVAHPQSIETTHADRQHGKGAKKRKRVFVLPQNETDKSWC
jgi:hypothetical protein